jgi:Family of unknown function (DUF6445)
MFNPKPHIERVALPGGRACWVIDKVLLDPQAVVAKAVQNRSQFKPAQGNAYPGLEWGMPPDWILHLRDFFILHIRHLHQARRVLNMYSRLSLVTLQPEQLRPVQRLCHRDRFGVDASHCIAACTIYLFKESQLGGTGFYLPKQTLEQTDALVQTWHTLDSDSFTSLIGTAPGYITASNDYFEFVHAVPAAFNRAVFYDGGIFHSSHIQAPSLLSDDPARGRLTMNGFFICQRNAA